MLDAPPHPDDGRGWLTVVRNLGSGGGRMLLVLDGHPDRTLGARAVDTPMMAHREVAELLDTRPSIFKGNQAYTGSEWELCEGLNGIRWAKTTVTYTKQAILEWSPEPILIEYHPGPAPGASWVIIPESCVVFIGDLVSISQPPFLGDADIDLWVESLDVLLSKPYKDYLVVSSRGGIVEKHLIREQRRFLRDVQNRLKRLHGRSAYPEETKKLVSNLLSRFDHPPERHDMYFARLEYGLREHYIRHYFPEVEDEET